MKYLFILSLLIHTLISCSDVTDITKEKVPLINGYELIYRDTVNSIVYEYPIDTIGTNRIIYGRLIYTPGLKFRDSVIFNYMDTNYLLLMKDAELVRGKDTNNFKIYTPTIRTYTTGLKYSSVFLFRNDTLIYTGHDTIFVK